MTALAMHQTWYLHCTVCHGPNLTDTSGAVVTDENGLAVGDARLGSDFFVEELEELSTLHIFIKDFEHVQYPYLVVCILLVVSFARVGTMCCGTRSTNAQQSLAVRSLASISPIHGVYYTLRGYLTTIF